MRDSKVPVGKREIARAFHIKGPDRQRLKAVMRELKAEGALAPEGGKRVRPQGTLPEVAVLEVGPSTSDGDMTAKPAAWDGEGPPPQIYVMRDRRGDPGEGERILARLSRQPDGTYQARTIKRLKASARRLLGIVEADPLGLRLKAADKKARHDYLIAPGESQEAQPGELVLAELLPGKPLGRRHVRVVERHGDGGDTGVISLIAIQEHGIPMNFTAEALEEAEKAKPVTARGRADLRTTPLVTIDGSDARDFDDAVFAEPDDDKNNSGGWHLIVAIADVAHYVRPGSALDKSAFERGNSVYFPDRVVPMLPEALSNDLCSLRPGQDRACLAAHLWIDQTGRLKRHRFERALMRSAARLTYDEAQAAADGRPNEKCQPLMTTVIEPLYRAFNLLAAARSKRQALEIDLPDRRVELGPDGKVSRIAVRERFDSHKLIEEFMITANVAAAEALEAKRRPCMYRVHDQPDIAKLEGLRDVLGEFGYSLPKGQVIRPGSFNSILRKAANTPHERAINELILRAQTQAYYGPDNLGHFGLALSRYAHFTSPIRRYSDLLVHRALIDKRAKDSLPPEAEERFPQIGEHISKTERRAMAAERDSVDRFVASFMAAHVGTDFTGAIVGVTRFGLFVELTETGADGLVPVSTLPADRYAYDEDAHSLVGQGSGRIYKLGEAVQVRLKEADPVSGGMVFELLDDLRGRAKRTGAKRGKVRLSTKRGKRRGR